MKIKKLKSGVVIPDHAKSGDAGYDLRAVIESEIYIEPNETKRIPTGLAVEIPKGLFGFITGRSGLFHRNALMTHGVIDSGYRGEIMVTLYNGGKNTFTVKNGERIAQLIFIPFLDAHFEETDELTDTERGDNGFGSTGKN